MFSNSIYNRAFIGLICANMFFWMSTNFFLPVLPLYYHSLGMNDHQVGIAIGAFSIGALLFRVFAGKLTDRYGSTPVITGGILLSILAILSYLYSVNVTAAVISRFLHGLGISCYSGAALTMASLMHEEQHTTEAVAMFTLFAMFGVGIASSSASWIHSTGGFLFVIAMGTTATLLSLLLFPKNPPLKIKPARADTLPLSSVVTNPGVYISTLSLTAVNICFASIMTFLPLLMVSKGITDFTGFYVAYAGAVIASRMWVRKLCAVLSPERLSYYILLLFTITMGIIAYFQSPLALLVCGASLGIGYGLAFPAMATIITACTQPANRGAAFGFYTMAVDAGFGAGAIIMGIVADLWGYNAVFLAAGLYTALYSASYRLWLWPHLQKRALVT